MRAGILRTDGAQRLQFSGFVNHAADKNGTLLSCKLDTGHGGGHFLLREWRHEQACAGLSMIQHGILHRPICTASGITHWDGAAENRLTTIENAQVTSGAAAASSGDNRDTVRTVQRKRAVAFAADCFVSLASVVLKRWGELYTCLFLMKILRRLSRGNKDEEI